MKLYTPPADLLAAAAASPVVAEYLAWRRAGNVPTLLSIGADAKTSKGEGAGYLTAIIYLSPADAAARATGLPLKNLCPAASEGCRAACLAETSGRMVFKANVRARLYRTLLYMFEPEAFRAALRAELKAFVRKAERAGLKPVCRPNGGQDILWERVFPELFAEFPQVRFYDYTKILPSRYRRDLPGNYHLTFSRAESNHLACLEFLAAGGNVAIVLDTAGAPLPETLEGFPVVAGDEDDVRLPERDGRGVWVALRPKGGVAARDTTGFVYRLSPGRRTAAVRILPTA